MPHLVASFFTEKTSNILGKGFDEMTVVGQKEVQFVGQSPVLCCIAESVWIWRNQAEHMGKLVYG